MNLFELILIAIGLAMDCFTVSFSGGAIQKNLKLKHTLLIAFCFGFFQAAMPLLGWLCGKSVIDYICHVDHWIAFVILLFIGGKMFLEGIRPDKEEKAINMVKPSTLIILSIATSIDALAIGFSFSMLRVNIWFSVLLIGIASFVLSVLGVFAGKKLGNLIKPQYAEILGGIILIAIGTKILLSHLLA